MPVNIVIVGLGRIGASIGLALAKYPEKVVRIGHDKLPEVVQKAKKLGAIDKIEYNLPDAARGADVVLLCLPMDQIEETLQVIREDLREDVVVMDTSPVKAPVVAWFKKHIAPGRHLVGLVPSISALHFEDIGSGVGAASNTLFLKTTIGIVSPPGTPGAAIKLAADLSEMLGAEPVFMDMGEADSLMTAVHILPQFLAASLVNTTVNQPGWPEGRKLASLAFANASRLLVQQDAPEALAASAVENSANTLRLLDLAIAALQSMREAVARRDSKLLTENVEQARLGRIHWADERQAADWASEQLGKQEKPKAGDFWRRLFGAGTGSGRNSRPG